MLFGFATAGQLLYWGFVFSRLAFYREQEQPEQNLEISVSVIICARNESANLKKFLPHFLNQNYRSFEIIVVNDNSSDHTLKTLLEIQRKSPTLRIVTINDIPTLPGKKAALKKGIEAAQYDYVLLSDADCYPASNQWINSMQKKVFSNFEIVLGFSPYICVSGSPLNVFIRFETIYTAVQYFSFVLIGKPYMGVGRNLLYKKSLFFDKDSFSKHAHLASGDDDLFINEAATSTNTTINLSPDTFVYSRPKSSWRGYYHQKSRHLTTGTKYKVLHKVLLGGLSLTHFLHYICAIFLMLSPEFRTFVIFLILVRLGVVLLLYGRILKKLQSTSLLVWIPFLDAMYVLFYIIFAPTLIIGNKVRWK